MRGFDRTILTTVCLSASLVTATLFLLWRAGRNPDLEFSSSLGLSVLVGLVVPLTTVAVVQRFLPELSAGWLFSLYFGVCALLSLVFALAVF